MKLRKTYIMALKSKKGKKKRSATTKVEEGASKKSARRDPRETLNQFLKCDHYITLSIPKDLDKHTFKERLYAVLNKALCWQHGPVYEEWTEDNTGLVLGLARDNAFSTAEHLKAAAGGVIVGPDAESAEEVTAFHQLWGKSHCELRRFQDGHIRESIALSNPHGLAYFMLAKIKHLVGIHFESVSVHEHHLPTLFLSECLAASHRVVAIRNLVDLFCKDLRELSGSELPLRKVQATCNCMYGAAHNHTVPMGEPSKVATNKSGYLYLREKSNMAPPQTSSIQIQLEVTQKTKMSTAMFARLRMMYVLKLSELLQQKLKLTTMVQRDSVLYVIYKCTLFKITIPYPKNEEGEADKALKTLQEFLSGVCLRNTCFAGLRVLIHKWAAANYLSLSVPETTLDLLAAHVFVVTNEQTPSTIERGFLNFLNTLSFTDFEKTPLVLNEEECGDLAPFKWNFDNKRKSLPALCIITPQDPTNNWSCFTRDLEEPYLRRLVNCARLTLHSLMSASPPRTQDILDNLNAVSENNYDVLLHFKSLQVPLTKNPAVSTTGNDMKPSTCFPVIDYDPVGSFWQEARDSFGKEAQFYYNANALKMGIKLVGSRDDEAKAMLEDLQVIGKGLIKEVVWNISK